MVEEMCLSDLSMVLLATVKENGEQVKRFHSTHHSLLKKGVTNNSA
jgi:hypothetical protein